MQPQKRAALKLFSGAGSPAGSLLEQIRSRQTEELVIAFCGALGSGTSKVAENVKDVLRTCNYEVEPIVVSELIGRIASRSEGVEPSSDANAADRIRRLQDLGNGLRKKYGNDVLALAVINEIGEKRALSRVKSEDEERVGEPSSRRVATLIDSLKHPDEYHLLKSVYGDMFYMFGVLCPEGTRKSRLVGEKGFSPEEANSLMDRDRGEKFKYGQQLLDTIHLSDFFIGNIERNESTLEDSVKRFIQLIFGRPGLSPTVHEYAMYAAHAASLRSCCMSRQVGAAIIDASGDIVSTGRNDVPRYGGGLYGPEDGPNDARCAKSGSMCRSDMHKGMIFKKLKAVVKKELSKVGDKDMDVDAVVGSIYEEIADVPELRGLIEFSRAVHAEMDAITAAARNGHSLYGSSLYCTTFPCHHCARHIVSSGIHRVFYIEPYEKSLAVNLHHDSIQVDAKNDGLASSKVKIIPFEGVAPKQYMNLFSKHGDLKEDGKLVKFDITKAKPVVPKYMDNYIRYEAEAVKHFHKEMKLDEEKS